MAAFATSSTSSSYPLKSSPLPLSNNFYPSTFYPQASFNQGWVYPYQGGYHQNPSMDAPAVQGYQEYSNTSFVFNNPSSFKSAHNNTFNITVNNTTGNSSFSFPGPVQQQYSEAQNKCTEPVVQHPLKDSGAAPLDEKSKPESEWKKVLRR